MQLFKSLRRKSEGHNSISTLPLLTWVEIQETGNVSLLSKGKVEIEKLLAAWERINDEYLEAFGISEQMEANLNEKRLAAISKANYLITGKRHYLTFSEIHLENANKVNLTNSKIDIEQNLARLTKFYGVRLRASELTVKEYYTYVKEAQNGRKDN